ncbi:hypothetical protein E3N88_37202 [Mikania micrantha]|uniref:Uncharacterized protein n=1 Tax=Mikania micrantha TaxID=192012 RepID=A0A5N6M6D5_9ASTR|nr:hypothetical protein E3N88_37202 [Mikania micrantha]
MCDQSGGEVGHRRHQTTEQSVGDGGSGTTNDWRATIGRRWRIMDEQESARDGRKMIGDGRRPEEPQSMARAFALNVKEAANMVRLLSIMFMLRYSLIH